MNQAPLLEYFQGIVAFLLVIIGFLLRNLLSDIKEKLRNILVQVNLTNGRVGVLENQVNNNKAAISQMWERLNHYIDRFTK